MPIQVETGAISAAGAISAPFRLHGPFNLTVTGVFAASAVLERSFDGGQTWFPMTYPDGSQVIITSPCSLSLEASRMTVLGRIRCLAYASGELAWRLSR